MKKFEAQLVENGYAVMYIDYKQTKDLPRILREKNITELHVCEVDDDWLSRKIKKISESLSCPLIIHESPSFLTPFTWSKEYYGTKKKYFQTNFYIEQRKRLGILLDVRGEPVGGSWTYDTENRKRLPKNISLPQEPKIFEDTFIKEGRTYIHENFKDNPGSMDYFVYPSTHDDAEKLLDNFLVYKLPSFGTYQDALTTRSDFVFHSVLSPLINVGLITPDTVVKKTLTYAKRNKVELNSVEGFIRQIIGWREFFRAVYRLESRKQRTKNHFSFTRKIPHSFWQGNTGIMPVDLVIQKVLKTGYAHHIERLMVLGNFMLLCEFDPDDVYEWFMIFFIDAYDWVMVPNVYGMSQYADGGLITTKPYISSSNYIKNMSDYDGGEWSSVWDGLYWRFIEKFKDQFVKNPRMSMMVKQLEKMETNKLRTHKKNAENYLMSL